MEISTWLLWLHIAGGMTALVSGFINTVNKKGGSKHRLYGKIYVASMFCATLSGVILAFLKENQFLFLVGVFSFYLCFSGWRVLNYKIIKPFRVSLLDYSVAFLTVLFSILMIFYGIKLKTNGLLNVNLVLVIFGISGLFISTVDLWKFFRVNKAGQAKFTWLYTHVGRMGGSYISAVTAFIVVNFEFLPPLVLWLGPSLIGTIFISSSIRRLKMKHQQLNS